MHLLLKTGVTGRKKYDNILSTLLFLYCTALPFEEALAFSFGSILRLLGIVIIAWCFFAHCRTVINLRDLSLCVPFILWFLLCLVSFFWSEDHSWWLYFSKIYAVQILFVLTVVAFQKYIDLNYIKNGLVTGAVIAAGILIFMPTSSALTEDGRRTLIIFGNEFDPNILASIIMMALIIVIDHVFKRKNKLPIILTAFMLVGLLYTGSRGALISTVVGVVVYFLLRIKDRKTRLKAAVLVLVGIIMVAAVRTILPEELLNSRFSLETLFGMDEYYSNTHNRWTIWKKALPLALNAPLLGYGCGNFFSIIATVYRQCASHNLYILLLIEGGIVSLIIFTVGLYRMLKAAHSLRQHATIALLLCVAVMSLSLDTITCKFFWVSIILTTLSITKQKEMIVSCKR